MNSRAPPKTGSGALLNRSKLSRPACPAGLVNRHRLLSRLDECLDRRLTLISAPPGFGKTTLAVQWLSRQSIRSAWLSLDPYDRDPERFALYLITALRSVLPDCLSTSAALLRSEAPPPWDTIVEFVVAEIGGISEPLVLAVDDFHLVSQSGEVEQLMVRIVESLPETLHLLVLTRADPPWPLARWRGRSWLGDLRAADLRFAQEEARALFAPGSPVALASDTVELLRQRTEGWITGLRLAQIRLADSPDADETARDFSGNERLIVDYLAGEVLAVQPADVREFLALTAPLDRFCAPLCDHLMADRSFPPDGSEMIAHLMRENLFLVPLDDEGRWYRYHHLFQQLILQHLHGLFAPAARAEVASRAAEWFAREGYSEEALRYWIEAGELDAAAGLVARELHNVIQHDLSRRELARWLAMFPAGAENRRPAMLVAHSYQARIAWDLPRMGALLRQARALLEDRALPISEEDRRSLLGTVESQCAFLCYWQGDAEAAVRHGARAMRVVPPQYSYAHGSAVVYAAVSLAILGRRQEAATLLADALEEDWTLGSRNAGMLLTGKAAMGSYWADLAEVEESARQLLSTHERVPMSAYWLGHAHFFLGRVAYERNLLEEAEAHLLRAEALRYRVPGRLYFHTLLALALIASVKGDAAAARAHGAAARAFAIEMNLPATFIRLVEMSETRRGLRPGEAGLDPASRLPPDDCNQYWIEVPTLMWVENRVSGACPPDCDIVLGFIDDALRRAEQRHNRWQAIQYLAVKAVALNRARRTGEALEMLRETVERARPLGLVRSLVDRGEHLRDLLASLAEQDPADRYLETLLAACIPPMPRGGTDPPPGPGPRAGGPARSVPPLAGGEILTNRETDVLELLAQRLSNKEIGNRLGIGAETVKKHALSVYRKLGAHGRRQAVAFARAQGLLLAERDSKRPARHGDPVGREA